VRTRRRRAWRAQETGHPARARQLPEQLRPAARVVAWLADTVDAAVTLRDGAGGHFGDLLAGAAVRTWAGDLPGRPESGTRDLRGSLRAWIAAGGNAERAAQRLGVHAQTVREHVRAAEPVLERRLPAGGRDLYEVVLAHVAAGELDRPALGAEEQGDRDPRVHR
jgi:hypothetical protein